MTEQALPGGAGDPWDLAQLAGEQLVARMGGPVDVGVVLGSGWSAAADALGPVVAEVDLDDVAGFVAPTVPTHRAGLVVVEVGATGASRRVAVLLGRVHLYEGHDPHTVVHPVRALAAAGASGLVLTNAAGAIDPALEVGSAVLVADHLNGTGSSPLRGPAPPEGPVARFVDLTDLYSARRRDMARAAAGPLPEATYAGLAGPHFETPAEIRALGRLGAGLVGFSTVLEAIAGHQRGMEVLAVSLVTNAAAGLADQVAAQEVLDVASRSGSQVAALLRAVLGAW